MAQLRVDVWSDIACPWCYVGKRRLERALEQFPHAKDVHVVWHSFELDPGAPQERDPSISQAEHIAKKYGMSIAQAKANSDRLCDTARAEGLAFDFDHIRSGNTFDAHRLIHLGHDKGVQDSVKERFMKAYLEQNALMSDHSTLTKLAVEAGLNESDVTDVLASDQYAAEVRADEAQARELGISGVPFFVIDGRLGVSGAQTPQVLVSALTQAWAEREPEKTEFAEGAVCGPDGC
ncbi:MAG: DsbA family oxidoreductase [Polyangiaceae bacterium]